MGQERGVPLAHLMVMVAVMRARRVLGAQCPRRLDPLEYVRHMSVLLALPLTVRAHRAADAGLSSVKNTRSIICRCGSSHALAQALHYRRCRSYDIHCRAVLTRVPLLLTCDLGTLQLAR